MELSCKAHRPKDRECQVHDTDGHLAVRKMIMGHHVSQQQAIVYNGRYSKTLVGGRESRSNDL